MTLDGYLDTTNEKSLRISSEGDLSEVHRLRGTSDAILVGAETIRSDDCLLTVRHGHAASNKPMRITLTRSGCLDFSARFFDLDGAQKVIFCPANDLSRLKETLPEQSVLVAYDGDSCTPLKILETLWKDGVQELLIEGGASTISQFIRDRLVDRMRLAIGPNIVGSAGKTRLFDSAPATPRVGTIWRLDSVEEIDDTVVIWYQIDNDDAH